MDREVEVASLSYRIVHVIVAILLVTLITTGLMGGEIDENNEIKNIGESGEIEGIEEGNSAINVVVPLGGLHTALGMSLFATAAGYTAFLTATGRIRTFDGIRRPISRQVSEAIGVIRHYITGAPLPDEIERHNVLASYLTLFLAGALSVQLVSGAVMAFGRGVLPEGVLEIAEEVHEVGWILILVFVVFHLFAVLHPSNRPLLKAMFGNGRVPIDWARRHMPGYLKRLGVVKK